MFRKTREKLDEIRHKVDLIETVLLVRDPGSTRAAEAYEGLRKQVVASAQERRAHLAHLAQIDCALQRGETLEELRLLLRELLPQVGLHRVDEYDADVFEVLGGAVEAPFEIVEPAYVDAVTASVVRIGRVRPASVDVSSSVDSVEAGGDA